MENHKKAPPGDQMYNRGDLEIKTEIPADGTPGGPLIRDIERTLHGVVADS